MSRFYKFISYAFSPQAVAFYITIVFSLFSPIGLGYLDVTSSILIGFLFLFLLPLFSVFYFSREDLNVTKRSKRNKIYLIYIISFLISSIIFWINSSHIMFVISLSYFSVTLSLLLINLFFKISAHSAGVAGPTTALVYVFGINLIPVFLITLLVMYARIKLKFHNKIQTISGSIVAILVTFMVYFIFW